MFCTHCAPHAVRYDLEMPGDQAAVAALALLMFIAGIYDLRGQEWAAPNVVLFLMALFVIVRRWP